MLDNYKIIKELNKGASGITYLVKKNNKIFVIKRQKFLKMKLKLIIYIEFGANRFW